MTIADTPTLLAETGTGTDADRVAIATLTQKVVASWAYADATGFASVFTEDGTMILPGVFHKGRTAIEAYMTEAFAGRYADSQVTGQPIDIRFLAPDVALLLTMGGVLEKGRTELDADSAIRASWLAVRRGGEWWLAAYQNSPRD